MFNLDGMSNMEANQQITVLKHTKKSQLQKDYRRIKDCIIFLNKGSYYSQILIAISTFRKSEYKKQTKTL